MNQHSWQVVVGPESTTALYETSTSGTRDVIFLCAHGAGGNISDRSTERTAQVMRRAGAGVVRFNFPYKEKKRGRPDPMPVLMETIRAVAAHIRQELGPKRLVIGGRSMGGRAASMLAADGFEADGLLLLAYPLHPAGRPAQLRDAHLPRITMPVLCINGTRDSLCIPDIMQKVLGTVGPRWQMHWVEGADHSFHVLKASGRTDSDVMDEIEGVSRAWLAGLPAASS
jgi:uncharacterized protein